MDALGIVIKFAAQGTAGVQADIKQVAAAATKIHDATKEAAKGSKQLQDALDKIGTNRGLRDATQQASALKSALTAVGTAGGLEAAELHASQFIGRMDAAKASVANLTQVLGGVRMAGLAIAAAGAGGMLLSRHMIGIAQEAERADEKLRAMSARRGEGGRFQELDEWAQQLAHDAAMVEDDPIKEAAAGLYGFGLNAEQIKSIMPALIGQSRLYKIELSQVAMQFGKAFSSGNVLALRRSGVTLGPEQVAAIEKIKASGASWGEQQRQILEILKNSMKNYALSITEGMGEGEKAANRLKLAIHENSVEMGKGAEAAQTQITNGLLVPLLRVIGAAPSLQYAAGYLGYFGSGALAAGGSLLTLGSQIVMTSFMLKNMGITSGVVFGIMKAGAASTITFIRGITGALLATVAVLSAGIAIGVAGYEALRALIPGFGATHASTGEILNYYRKQLTGDVEGQVAALDKGVPSAAASMPMGMPEDMPEAMPAMAVAPGVAAAAPTMAAAAPAAAPAAMLPENTAGALQGRLDALRAQQRQPGLSKGEKVALANQVAAVGIQMRNARAADTANRKANAESRRQQAAQARGERIAGGAETYGVSAGASEQAALAKAQQDLQKERDELAMNRQLRQVRQLEKSGVLDSTAAQARSEAIKKAYEARNKAMEADAIQREAEINAQAAIAEASSNSAGRTAAEQAALMKRAQAKAQMLRNIARYKATGLREQAADDQAEATGADSASGLDAVLGYLKAGGSTYSLLKKKAGQLVVGQPSYSQDSSGNVWLQFPPLQLPSDRMAGAY